MVTNNKMMIKDEKIVLLRKSEINDGVKFKYVRLNIWCGGLEF